MCTSLKFMVLFATQNFLFFSSLLIFCKQSLGNIQNKSKRSKISEPSIKPEGVSFFCYTKVCKRCVKPQNLLLAKTATYLVKQQVKFTQSLTTKVAFSTFSLRCSLQTLVHFLINCNFFNLDFI